VEEQQVDLETHLEYLVDQVEERQLLTLAVLQDLIQVELEQLIKVMTEEMVLEHVELTLAVVAVVHQL
tara:strand:- start:140 stop:343 length:204 start_codon:yes stop_codon:yes gene_type:complete